VKEEEESGFISSFCSLVVARENVRENGGGQELEGE